MGAQTSKVPLPKHTIKWHRTKLSPEVSKELHRTSDVKGAIQTLSFLGNLGLSFGLALYFNSIGFTITTIFFVALYGMQANFLINGMHELGHGFVFRTKIVNNFFLRLISFLGWLHPDMFFSSHLRHHRYTQNAPYDMENPMPVLLSEWDFLSFGFINVKGFFEIMDQTWRAATQQYPTRHLGWLPNWEETCYPTSKPEARQPAMLWAQFMIAGHLLIFAASLYYKCLLVSLMLSLGPFYNGWLFWLCNSTQHIGLDHGTPERPVEDFRLTTRTFYLNSSIVRMWYWHMNWHTEHHMYAAVPCYNLAALHEEIKHDLPPTPNGIVETWKTIAKAVENQRTDPSYFQKVDLPNKDK